MRALADVILCKYRLEDYDRYMKLFHVQGWQLRPIRRKCIGMSIFVSMSCNLACSISHTPLWQLCTTREELLPNCCHPVSTPRFTFHWPYLRRAAERAAEGLSVHMPTKLSRCKLKSMILACPQLYQRDAAILSHRYLTRFCLRSCFSRRFFSAGVSSCATSCASTPLLHCLLLAKNVQSLLHSNMDISD